MAVEPAANRGLSAAMALLGRHLGLDRMHMITLHGRRLMLRAPKPFSRSFTLAVRFPIAPSDVFISFNEATALPDTLRMEVVATGDIGAADNLPHRLFYSSRELPVDVLQGPPTLLLTEILSGVTPDILQLVPDVR